MVQISKKKLHQEMLKKLFKLFFEAFSHNKSYSQFTSIVSDLFSETEQIMIAKRIAIYYLLVKKIDFYTISNVLKVTPGTISKFSLIKEKSKGIVPYFQRAIKNEKFRDFLENIFINTLGSPSAPGRSWSSYAKYQYERERKKIQGI